VRVHHGQSGVASCGGDRIALAGSTTDDVNAVDCEDCLWTMLAITIRGTTIIASRLKTVQCAPSLKVKQ
jgi:hypothetical protein